MDAMAEEKQTKKNRKKWNGIGGKTRERRMGKEKEGSQ